MNPKDRLIIAIDKESYSDVLIAVDNLREQADFFKIGSTAFNASGPDLVRAVTKLGKKVFLDLKFFDIPEQVAGAARAVVMDGVAMITVHTLGGPEMMAAVKQAAAGAAAERGIKAPLVVGVTVLTSLDDVWLKRLGLPDTKKTVINLALAAKAAGLDGVVASARETADIKQACGQEFLTVVPGIRPAGSDADDQKRIATPGEAIANGADFLVVGRPITSADDPGAAAALILSQMGGDG